MLRRQVNLPENGQNQHLLNQQVSSSRNDINSALDIQDESYAELVQPSYGRMFIILLRKHFLVGKRRWQLLFALGMQAFYAWINWMLWWLVQGFLTDSETQSFAMFILFRNLTPAFFVFAMKSTIDTLLAEMVGEKESKMKTVQMVYGVPPWLYCSAHYFYFVCSCIPASVIWTVSLHNSSFAGVNQLLVLLMFQLAYAHIFFWSTLLSSFINKLQQVNTASLILMVLQLIPVGLGNVSELPAHFQILLGFMPTTSLNYWAQGVILLRLNGIEWTWDEDFFRSALDVLPDGAASISMQELPSPGLILIVFLLQVPFWGAFAYWCDQVIQAEHGTAKPLTFLFQPRYMCPKRLPDKTGLLNEKSVNCALQINHLTKSFSRGGGRCGLRALRHNAVDDMNLSVFCGEIFALLGHNGAGKTTAINCITGMVPSTSGTWEIMGLNGITDVDRCRSNLSVCPQDNPMYKELTVGEHIAFFSAVRGTNDVQKEIVEILKALGITVKRDCKCGDLSGGQKRRLWVATALVGKAPLVFLDEPTSGMDPSSRRELWSLLLRMKGQGRTIIFTTHYLEEADTLADRKAVLSKGKVKAVGTSNELKLKFGAGYRLKIFVQRSIAEAQSNQIKQLVLGSVPGAIEEHLDLTTQADDAPLELRFTLPYNQVSAFSTLFLSIETQTDALLIVDFELGMTSLEDVFMSLGKEDQVETNGVDSMKNLEFQQLLKETQLDEIMVLTSIDYAKILFWLRTKQLFGPGMSRTFLLPIGVLFYSLSISTAFFTQRHVAVANFALYPGVVLGAAGMRFITGLVQEREMKVSHVMLSQGMPDNVYWIVTCLHASLPVIFFGLVICTMVYYYGHDSFTGGANMYFIFASGCLSPIPLFLFFYLVSNYFQSQESATRFCGLFLTLASFVQMLPLQLWGLPMQKLVIVASVLHVTFSFTSPVYFMGGVMVGCWRARLLGHETGENGILDRLQQYSPWIPFVGQSCLSAALCVAIVIRKRRRLLHSNQTVQREEKASRRDDDVLLEEERVHRTTPEAEACLFRSLHHTYFARGKQKAVDAVQGISLGIKHGECFGLLGPNGAGKTTTLACLTGEIRPPTRGDVFIAGHNVLTGNIAEAYKQLGNCPQVDPLFPNLSGREILSFYGCLKGVPPKYLREIVDVLLQRLGIDQADRDKLASKYSGGMKRKVSLGIALIGRSNVLFLDEPSASVDAGSKRLLWQVIKKRAAGRTVIITTHSMEEAEAICDRIAIQVLGQLRCIGTPLHLKSKYAKGYQVALRLKKQEVNGSTDEDLGKKLLEFLDSSLSTQTQLLEVYDGSFLFQLPRFEKGKLTLGNVFARLEEAKETMGIEEYTLTQASLEQVFLRFAREQEGESEEGARALPPAHSSECRKNVKEVDEAPHSDTCKRARLSCP